jgi:hypothetical protein
MIEFIGPLYNLLTTFHKSLSSTGNSRLWLLTELNWTELNWTVLSQSQSYVRPTVSRPVCFGIKHSSAAWEQIYITVRQLRVCWCGALSLTRGRVCRLPETSLLFWASRYIASGRTPQKLVAHCCTHYLVTDCLSRICLRGKVFIGPVPSNGSIRHSILKIKSSNFSVMT